MKRYGQLVRLPDTLTDEKIAETTPGVCQTDKGFKCIQCGTTERFHFYCYKSPFSKKILYIVGIVLRWGGWIQSAMLL
nr:hypothetical protein [Staphylococcus agnetis]